jgi:hypothetical protein
MQYSWATLTGLLHQRREGNQGLTPIHPQLGPAWATGNRDLCQGVQGWVPVSTNLSIGLYRWISNRSPFAIHEVSIQRSSTTTSTSTTSAISSICWRSKWRPHARFRATRQFAQKDFGNIWKLVFVWKLRTPHTRAGLGANICKFRIIDTFDQLSW